MDRSFGREATTVGCNSARQEVLHLNRITKKRLKELCKKDKLYQTPSLNDVLYLHYQGFECIECLEDYTGLKCLWLESNAISHIQGLESQSKLKCLFLQNNLIRRIENLQHCPELDTLNLSSNHIRKIENCGEEVLPCLSTLNLSSNYLTDFDALKELENCKTLSVLDLANNRIDDILVVKVFAKMPQLRVLVLQGNPVVSRLPQYRKTLILECKELTYLDSRPVFPRDRACAEAWKAGGYEGERRENERWNRMDRKKIRDSVNATIRMRNRHLPADKQDQLLPSDSEEDDVPSNRPKRLRADSANYDAMWDEVASSDVPAESSDSDSDNKDVEEKENTEELKNDHIKPDNLDEEEESVPSMLKIVATTEPSTSSTLNENIELPSGSGQNRVLIEELPGNEEEREEKSEEVDVNTKEAVHNVEDESHVQDLKALNELRELIEADTPKKRIKLEIEVVQNVDPEKESENISQECESEPSKDAEVTEDDSPIDVTSLKPKTEEQLKREQEVEEVNQKVIQDFEDLSSKMETFIAELNKDRGSMGSDEQEENTPPEDKAIAELPASSAAPAKITPTQEPTTSKAYSAYETEERELRKLLQELEDENEKLYNINNTYRRILEEDIREEHKYQDKNTDENTEKLIEEIVREVIEDLPLITLPREKPKSYDFGVIESDEEYSYSDPPAPPEPPVRTVRNVIDSFNELLASITERNRKKAEQEKAELAQRVAEARKKESLNYLLNSPHLKEFGTDTAEDLDAQISALKEQEHRRVRKIVNRVYAKRDQYSDTLEVVDGKLVVVKKDTGEIEDLPPVKSSLDESDSDEEYESARSEDEDGYAERMWNVKTASANAFTLPYKPTMRRPAQELMKEALERFEKKQAEEDEEEEEFHSLEPAKPSVFQDIDEEFFNKLDFKNIKLEEEDENHIVECVRSYEDLKHLLKEEKEEIKLNAQEEGMFEEMLEHAKEEEQEEEEAKARVQERMLLRKMVERQAEIDRDREKGVKERRIEFKANLSKSGAKLYEYGDEENVKKLEGDMGCAMPKEFKQLLNCEDEDEPQKEVDKEQNSENTDNEERVVLVKRWPPAMLKDEEDEKRAQERERVTEFKDPLEVNAYGEVYKNLEMNFDDIEHDDDKDGESTSTRQLEAGDPKTSDRGEKTVTFEDEVRHYDGAQCEVMEKESCLLEVIDLRNINSEERLPSKQDELEAERKAKVDREMREIELQIFEFQQQALSQARHTDIKEKEEQKKKKEEEEKIEKEEKLRDDMKECEETKYEENLSEVMEETVRQEKENEDQKISPNAAEENDEEQKQNMEEIPDLIEEEKSKELELANETICENKEEMGELETEIEVNSVCGLGPGKSNERSEREDTEDIDEIQREMSRVNQEKVCEEWHDIRKQEEVKEEREDQKKRDDIEELEKINDDREERQESDPQDPDEISEIENASNERKQYANQEETTDIKEQTNDQVEERPQQEIFEIMEEARVEKNKEQMCEILEETSDNTQEKEQTETHELEETKPWQKNAEDSAEEIETQDIEIDEVKKGYREEMFETLHIGKEMEVKEGNQETIQEIKEEASEEMKGKQEDEKTNEVKEGRSDELKEEETCKKFDEVKEEEREVRKKEQTLKQIDKMKEGISEEMKEDTNIEEEKKNEEKTYEVLASISDVEKEQEICEIKEDRKDDMIQEIAGDIEKERRDQIAADQKALSKSEADETKEELDVGQAIETEDIMKNITTEEAPPDLREGIEASDKLGNISQTTPEANKIMRAEIDVDEPKSTFLQAAPIDETKFSLENQPLETDNTVALEQYGEDYKSFAFERATDKPSSDSSVENPRDGVENPTDSGEMGTISMRTIECNLEVLGSDDEVLDEITVNAEVICDDE